MRKVFINIDGGSRGNPGPAAFAAVIADENGEALKTCAQYFGNGTNNEAEYSALIFALKKAKALFGKEAIKALAVEVRSDSELLIKQMKGEYKVIDPKIQQLFLEAWNLRVDFKNLHFTAIPREENILADRLVNEALDAQEKSPGLFSEYR